MLAVCSKELYRASGVTFNPSNEPVKPQAHKRTCSCLPLPYKHRSGPASYPWDSYTNSTGKRCFCGQGVLKSSGSCNTEAAGWGGCQPWLAAALATEAGAEAVLAVRQADKCWK